MKTVLIQKTYCYDWDGKLSATIVFKRDADGKMIFDKCNYVCYRTPYTLKDWQFLGDLAQEIKRLVKEEEK